MLTLLVYTLGHTSCTHAAHMLQAPSHAVTHTHEHFHRPTIVKSWIAVFGRWFAMAGILKFGQDALLFAGPIILRRVQCATYSLIYELANVLNPRSYEHKQFDLQNAHTLTLFSCFTFFSGYVRLFFFRSALTLVIFLLFAPYPSLIPSSQGVYSSLTPLFIIFSLPHPSQIVSFVQHKNEPMYMGILYVAILFLATNLQTLLLHQYFYHTYGVGMVVRHIHAHTFTHIHTYMN